MANDEFSKEVKRIIRVSDMLCTMHAFLRDRYSYFALMLDLGILASSTWLVAMVFVEPQIGTKLSPFGINSTIWLGLLSIVTFFLSIIQIKVSWKERSDAHKRSGDIYASVKREANYILAQEQEISLDSFRRVIDRYDAASDNCISIPEKHFIRLKKKHILKVNTSRYLDSNPSCSIVLLRLKWWINDNINVIRKGG
jgi:hypothetical protein